MGKTKSDSDSKSQLVLQICNISNQRISSCVHRRHPFSVQSPLIDWYLVLQVDENAGIDAIRKQYLRLVLQLHPDKNEHPKAEFAFKVVSEAYACLSDNARRADFDMVRKNSSCVECSSNSSSRTSNVKCRGKSASEKQRNDRILQRMKDLRERFVEEANVIENCLKANAASRKELPTFNPTDYVHHGYPHHSANFRRFNSRKYVIHDSCTNGVIR